MFKPAISIARILLDLRLRDLEEMPAERGIGVDLRRSGDSDSLEGGSFKTQLANRVVAGAQKKDQ
ncbi:hypothetical protein [Labrys sp. ZIDIC5]|uniref:hypothetical protein n=1 Tax=Labrys sedimenti TaxID=3106036 RepID=UPI002ACAF3AE|nr:hypothetical protein [Labrys sp. ZIDIC5]MDZ5454797.1 hypothetical protein [Labrys sp. ZIDIC5]